MGLDITYCSNVKLLKKAPLSDEDFNYDYETECIAGYNMEEYKERAHDIIFGLYKVEQKGGFRAGSYSGYNEWRDHLCRMLYGISAVDFCIYKTGEELPFAELINFADNEGTLGTQVCQKLLRDFQQYNIEATLYRDKIGGEEGKWWWEKYMDWQHAFEVASNNGFVLFH